ncbi:MAG: MG2 domain-containing protein [Bacillota bacterium]
MKLLSPGAFNRWAVLLAVIWCLAVLSFAMAHETPVGTIEGRVTAADTGRPIPGASVLLHPAKPAVPESEIKPVQADEEGRFLFEAVPAGEYTIEAISRIHSVSPAKITLREGEVKHLDLALTPGPYYFNLYNPQHTFMTAEKPQVVLDGFTPGDYAVVDVYRVNTDMVFAGRAGFVYEILMNPWGEIAGKTLSKEPAIEARESMKVKINSRDNEGVYHQRVELGQKPPGIYVVTVSTAGMERTSWFAVGDVGLVTKESGGDLLAYVVELESGRPVPGAEIKVLQGSKIVHSCKTGADGMWRGPVKSDRNGPVGRLIIARKGESPAFVSTYWETPRSEALKIYAYTDRPVYRPGQEVHFKGIVREFFNDLYRVPQQGQARVQVRDRRDTLVYSGSFSLTRFGSFFGQFTLPEYAPTGPYYITCTFGGHTETAFFTVAEYRKPEFAVSVKMPDKHCVRGQKVKAKIKAEYYFGAPVVGAEVQYTVFRADYWFWPGQEEFYGGYEEYGNHGEVVAEGTALTDARGETEVRFLTEFKQPESNQPVDQRFTVAVTVTEKDGRAATGEGTIIATQGEFSIGVEPARWVVAPGETARFKLTAFDYDGKPQRGVALNVTASRVRWEAGKETATAVTGKKVRTDNSGHASFEFTPEEPGSYVIKATGRDDRGNRITSATWIWVAGEGEFSGYRYPDLEIFMDKKTYEPGDTAKVLINAGEEGAAALLTVEGRNLYEHRLLMLNSRSALVEIPVRAEYRPNFYVSVCYVKEKKFVTQTAEARVSLKQQTLKLTVTPEKKKYGPGEEVNCTVKTTDAEGRPVQAEVSLGVIDEAIYAIREDDTRPILDYFYSRQDNLVATNYSFPDIYLSGDKTAPTGEVRQDFADTACWLPAVVTDEKGEARISFKLPDNLTTWRFTARGCTLDTAVGECTASIIAAKDFLVRLQTPRFLVAGDEAMISALVHNYLPEEQEVTVALAAPDLKLRNPSPQTVRVRGGGVEQVAWPATAAKLGMVSLTVYARCPAADDAMRLTLPVHPPGRRVVETRTGTLAAGSVTEKLTVRSEAFPGASEIRVRLAPSLAAAMLGGLEYLARYPYGCTEQTMSAFLPDVVIWRTMKSLGIRNPELEKQIPDMVGKGLNRLYDFQRSNSGGWGWCQYGRNDLWMTSYVVFGLLTAREAGFAVNEDVLSRGLAALEQALALEKKDVGKKIYGLYVLSLGGQKEKVKAGLEPVLNGKTSLNPRETALVTLTLHNTGETALARKYLERLWEQANVTPGEIYWESKTEEYYEASTETTALALTAVIKLTPADERTSKIVRWLTRQRRFNHWLSTRDTALVLYALSEYLALTRETNPDFTVTVSCNGEEIKTVRFDKDSLFAPEQEIRVDPGKVRTGENSVAFTVYGRGMLYYTVELKQFLEDSPPGAPRSGITVKREYRKLISRRDDKTGTISLQPAKFAATGFKNGDVVRVRLTVNSPRAYRHLIVEDYLPAGCEAFDRGRMELWEWSYWWVDRDVRDDRVTFYIETLPKGESVLEYEMRAGVPGTYRARPPLVEAMYRPDVAAHGVEQKVSVR